MSMSINQEQSNPVVKSSKTTSPLEQTKTDTKVELQKQDQEQLEKIVAAFGQLKDKKDELLTKAKTEPDTNLKENYTNAGLALENIILQLNEPIERYQDGTATIENLRKSVSDVLTNDAAIEGIKAIQLHRGSKQLWAEFVGAIFTVGLSLIYKALKGHSLFKVNTDTANRLEDLTDILKPRK